MDLQTIGLFFLDYFLDRFFGYVFGPFLLPNISLDLFMGGGGREGTHHLYSGSGGMQSISTKGGVRSRLLLLREGWTTNY